MQRRAAGREAECAGAARYIFTTQADLSPLLADLPETAVEATITREEQGAQICLKNTGAQAALGVWLEDVKADLADARCYAYFSDNYFCLLPGEQRAVQVRWMGAAAGEGSVRISGWNFPTAQV